MAGRKPALCPDVDELRRMVDSGDYNINQLCAHFGIYSRVLHRWREQHGIGLPRTKFLDLPGERWLPIAGYEGQYEVSDMGRVRSLDRIGTNGGFIKGRMIAAFKDRDGPHGYLHVGITKHSKLRTPKLHWLVLEAFRGPRPDGMQGCHNDGNRDDCRLTNLRWDTPKNNSLDRIKHGTQQRTVSVDLAKRIVAEARSNTRAERKRVTKLLGCDARVVWRVLGEKTWNHIDLIGSEAGG